MPSSAPPRYGVLVPVKPPAIAKSRLAELGEAARRALVVAFAADTVAAALECPSVAVVLAVTDDHDLARGLAQLGAEVLPDGTAEDLNGSLVQAAAELHRRWPDLRPVALTADLPALRPEELTHALAAAPTDRAAFVTDSEATGTTLVTAPAVELFRPRFGEDSRSAHLEAGLAEITVPDAPGLRRDVDRPRDLDEARSLGLGGRTAMVVTGLRL